MILTVAIGVEQNTGGGGIEERRYFTMNHIREKLIELLESVPQPENIYGQVPIGVCKIADHLIANGVTLDNQVSSSKWIPVTERLPDKDTLVLCIGSKGGMFLGYVRSLYCDETTAYTIVPNARGGRYTKYWMPLPEPPKEG
jgi:hypothetical protein